jgi:hypothetical protein
MTKRPWVVGPGGVGAGGDINGPVTVTVINGSFRRLREAIFDPDSLETELDLARFTGREWLIEQIDVYIASHRKGYVVVQAEAGVGKSALAAYLVWTRPCAHHFTRQEGARSPVQARRSLAAQLIGAWGLADEMAPGDNFPKGAGRPDWLVKVMKAAAARRDELHPGSPIVLVVDGLDEADPPARGQDTGVPLGLPRPESLPDKVFIVATTRFGPQMTWVRGRDSWHTIVVDGPDNLQDMRQYIVRAVEGPSANQELVALLAEHEVSPTWFAGALADRCGGVWIYLRYVLDAILSGQRTPDDLESLPTELVGYYLEQIEQWRRIDSWAAAGRLAITVLAALPGPATLAELADFSAVDKESLREWVDERLRSFLDVTQDPLRDPRYSIRHQSLRDLFRSQQDDDWAPWAGARAALRDAFAAAHSQIAAAHRRAAGRCSANVDMLPQARYEAVEHLLQARYHLRSVPPEDRQQDELSDLTQIAKLVVNDSSEEGEAAALLMLAVVARYAEDTADFSLWGIAEFLEEPSFYSGLQLVSYLSNVNDPTRPGHLFAAVIAEEFVTLDDEDLVERLLVRIREASAAAVRTRPGHLGASGRTRPPGHRLRPISPGPAAA